MSRQPNEPTRAISNSSSVATADGHRLFKTEETTLKDTLAAIILAKKLIKEFNKNPGNSNDNTADTVSKIALICKITGAYLAVKKKRGINALEEDINTEEENYKKMTQSYKHKPHRRAYINNTITTMLTWLNHQHKKHYDQLRQAQSDSRNGSFDAFTQEVWSSPITPRKRPQPGHYKDFVESPGSTESPDSDADSSRNDFQAIR